MGIPPILPITVPLKKIKVASHQCYGDGDKIPPAITGRSTLTETKTNTETEIDKMALVPNGIGLLVQNEHVHTIIYETFFSVSVLVSVYVNVKAPLQTSNRLKWCPLN